MMFRHVTSYLLAQFEYSRNESVVMEKISSRREGISVSQENIYICIEKSERRREIKPGRGFSSNKIDIQFLFGEFKFV